MNLFQIINLYELPLLILLDLYSIGLPLNSPYVDLFDGVLIKQIEAGEVEDFDSRWIIDRCVTAEDVEAKDEISPVTVSSVKGIFFALALAIVLSFCGLFYQVYSKQHEKCLAYKESVWHKGDAANIYVFLMALVIVVLCIN